MSTLKQGGVTLLIERLFNEASAATSPAMANIPQEEVDRLMHSRTEYLDFYGRMKDLWLPVSRETGLLLYMLARGPKAKTVVEFGTSFGISTIHLAAALRDNGGGLLITTEFEPGKVARAREHLKEGGLADIVEFREGDALVTLSKNLPETIDLLLLDGAKSLYSDVLNLVEEHLKPGSFIIADNANYSPDYLQYVRSSRNYLSIPFSGDLELSFRLT